MPKQISDERLREAIGARLKMAREARGWTQRDLADAVSMDPQNVSKIERGEQMPQSGFVHAACDALDMSADWLLYGRGDPPGEPVSPEDAAETERVIDEYLSSPRGRTAPPEVVAKLRDPRRSAFRELGVRRATWDDVDDVRRTLERNIANIAGVAAGKASVSATLTAASQAGTAQPSGFERNSVYQAKGDAPILGALYRAYPGCEVVHVRGGYRVGPKTLTVSEAETIRDLIADERFEEIPPLVDEQGTRGAPAEARSKKTVGGRGSRRRTR